MLRGITRAALLLALTLAAGISRADAGAEHLNALLQGMSSLQARFSQKTYDSKGQVVQNLSGEMQVKRPGLFRWDTTAPQKQLIVANGSTVWIYDPDLEQATQQKLNKQVGDTPALLLSGDTKQLAAAFAITEDSGVHGEAIYTLRPRQQDAAFESLQVTFSGRELTGMNLLDSLGQRTDIRFTQVRLNAALDNKLFEFTPPKGVDVISQ